MVLFFYVGVVLLLVGVVGYSWPWLALSFAGGCVVAALFVVVVVLGDAVVFTLLLRLERDAWSMIK